MVLLSDRASRPSRRLILAGALAGIAGRGVAQEKPLRLGLATSVSNQAAEIAAREATAQGLPVETIEFNDWNTPNRALADREIDLNLFQHVPFLEFTKAQTGYDLVPLGIAYNTPFGLYSRRYKALAELPENPRIAISGDPVNTGRSLLLLQKAGYVTLKPGADFRVGMDGITGYPKPIRIVQLDGPQIARTLEEMDAALTYPTFARMAGLAPDSALLFENDAIYAFRFVARRDRAQDARLLRFVAIYQSSPAAKAKLQELYGTLVTFPR
ncbi:MetQ/NlpA family ABC transporter substrate-binding protein [Bosea sp. TWI1241]|uniref:MetQ/NlpA family ABC transporter substrate-binding protein n=1 Tax=Bosea sp. TWI1241 TaxID=3148904 RepID=UPI0032081837